MLKLIGSFCNAMIDKQFPVSISQALIVRNSSPVITYYTDGVNATMTTEASGSKIYFFFIIYQSRKLLIIILLSMNEFDR